MSRAWHCRLFLFDLFGSSCMGKYKSQTRCVECSRSERAQSTRPSSGVLVLNPAGDAIVGCSVWPELDVGDASSGNQVVVFMDGVKSTQRGSLGQLDVGSWATALATIHVGSKVPHKEVVYAHMEAPVCIIKEIPSGELFTGVPYLYDMYGIHIEWGARESYRGNVGCSVLAEAV